MEAKGVLHAKLKLGAHAAGVSKNQRYKSLKLVGSQAFGDLSGMGISKLQQGRVG